MIGGWLRRTRDRHRALRAAALCLTVLAAVGAGACAGGSRTGEHRAADQVPLNRTQCVGTHNSYKEAIEPALYSILRSTDARVEALDYAHPPLAQQLDIGLRSLELDVYHDPVGGRYARPIGLALVRAAGREPAPFDTRGELAQPGFKVMHDDDVDFRSSVLSLEGALAELRRWSEAHPDHEPVIVTMNTKRTRGHLTGAVEPGPITPAVLDALDATLLAGLSRQRLLTPDDVRGNAATLNEAIRIRGWPALANCRGRFLFVLDEGGDAREAYARGRPSLAGRVMFTTHPPGEPESAFLVINDPMRDGDRIRSLVAQGYMVRTRADSETREARAADFTRARAAVESGAQVISTDYPSPDPRWHGGAYRVSLPGGVFWRVQPDRPHGG